MRPGAGASRAGSASPGERLLHATTTTGSKKMSSRNRSLTGPITVMSRSDLTEAQI
jgi:hypothetical protein